MRLRTRTNRRVMTAGIALVTAAAMTACSSDSDSDSDGGAPATDTPPSETIDESTPEAPVDDLILGQREAPGGGVVERLEHDQIREQVDQIVESQGRQLMVDPACDTVSRVPTVTNHALEDAAHSVIRYKQSETDETEHRFGVGLVSQRLDQFLDRSLYEACDTSATIANPDRELRMTVDDAPEVPGGEGFRVVSDFVTTQPDGNQSMYRLVVLHGFARGTTVNVEYEATSDDVTVDPVLPTAAGALDAIYVEQMTKLVEAP